MIFGSYSNSLPKEVKISIHKTNCNDNVCNCANIKRVNEAKYLGFKVDTNLNWKVHRNGLKTKKQNKVLYLFVLQATFFLHEKQLFTTVMTTTDNLLYVILVNSNLWHYSLRWSIGECLKSIHSIQKKIVKLIFHKPYDYPSEDLYWSHHNKSQKSELKSEL